MATNLSLDPDLVDRAFEVSGALADLGDQVMRFGAPGVGLKGKERRACQQAGDQDLT